jgi:hypothetical protein
VVVALVWALRAADRSGKTQTRRRPTSSSRRRCRGPGCRYSCSRQTDCVRRRGDSFRYTFRR